MIPNFFRAIKDNYFIWAKITFFPIFIGVWIYAIISWGFLIGLTIGWLPALIAGVIGGLIWPIFAIALILAILLGLYILKDIQ